MKIIQRSSMYMLKRDVKLFMLFSDAGESEIIVLTLKNVGKINPSK